MRRILPLGVLCFTLALTGCGSQKNATAGTEKIPSKASVLEVMQRTNTYFMNKWPDPGAPTFGGGKERSSNLWTRGVYYEGLMAMYEVDKNKAYYDYAVRWGESHHWGLRSGVQTRHADNHCAGQTYIDLYEIDGKKHPEWVKDIKESIDRMMATDKIDDWDWIDALQMAMPVYAKLGRLYNEPKYYERNYQMYAYTKHKHGGNGLYNPVDKLWWRDKDFVPPYTEPNGQDCYWSRGDGWVVAALVRTLDITPKTDPHYAEYLQDFKDLLSALPAIQREDGLWNVSLHDPTHFGGKEMTGSALFIYGMAYGINKGIIDRKVYLPVLLKAWDAIVKDCVQPNGFLGWVQGTGKEPKDGQPLSVSKEPDFEDYGLGCLLLAGSEVYKLK